MLGIITGLAATLGGVQPIEHPFSPVSQESAVPFVRSDGVHDWKADGNRGLYIQGIDGRWYYARTSGPCGRMITAVTLGFETRGIDELDRHGAILVEGWRCPLVSVVHSSAPPRKRR
jgi:hypothetical protein